MSESSSDSSDDEGDDVELKKRLVRSFGKSRGAGGVGRVDGLVQDTRPGRPLLRRTCANAATDKVDRDVVARRAARFGSGRQGGGRARHEAQRALDDARAARREVRRATWLTSAYKKKDAGGRRGSRPDEYAWDAPGALEHACLRPAVPLTFDEAALRRAGSRAVAAAAVVEARAERFRSKLGSAHGARVAGASSLAYAHTRSYVGAVQQRAST